MRRTLGARVALLIVASVATIGGASCFSPSPGPQEQTASKATAILGGAVDTTDDSVVAIEQKSTGAICSGIIVAPSVVLTAAHCVYGVNVSDLEVFVGSDVSTPTQTLGVLATVSYPTYAGESEGTPGGIDLAALTLSADPGITPISLDTDPDGGDLLQHAHVNLVGYGVLNTTTGAGAGVRRSATVEVTNVCSRTFTVGNAQANACFGDSGGAVLLQGALVAVISGGTTDCAAPASVTRLSAHAGWLASVLKGTAAGACAECVPADPSCTALIEGATNVDAGASSAQSPGGGCAVAAAAAHGGGRADGDGLAVAAVTGLALFAVRRARRGALQRAGA